MYIVFDQYILYNSACWILDHLHARATSWMTPLTQHVSRIFKRTRNTVDSMGGNPENEPELATVTVETTGGEVRQLAHQHGHGSSGDNATGWMCAFRYGGSGHQHDGGCATAETVTTVVEQHRFGQAGCADGQPVRHEWADAEGCAGYHGWCGCAPVSYMYIAQFSKFAPPQNDSKNPAPSKCCGLMRCRRRTSGLLLLDVKER